MFCHPMVEGGTMTSLSKAFGPSAYPTIFSAKVVTGGFMEQQSSNTITAPSPYSGTSSDGIGAVGLRMGSGSQMKMFIGVGAYAVP